MPNKGLKYDDTFKAEALCLPVESRRTQAAAAALLGIIPNLLYRWQPARPVATNLSTTSNLCLNAVQLS